jgi:hypothetical protein
MLDCDWSSDVCSSDLDDHGCIALALSYAPEVTDTNGAGMTVTHGQFSAMVGYNHHF